MSDSNDDSQGFVTQWSKIPIPKNPQRKRKLQRATQTLSARRERFKQYVKEQNLESNEFVQEVLRRMPTQHNVNMNPNNTPRIFMSEEDAFEMLCSECLRQERYPQDVLNKGQAKGWSARIKMAAEKWGWDIQISIRDKQ
jgi:hypothetical protein